MFFGRDAVMQLFEPWMASFASHMILLTFVETKVRPAAGNVNAILRCPSFQIGEAKLCRVSTRPTLIHRVQPYAIYSAHASRCPRDARHYWC